MPSYSGPLQTVVESSTLWLLVLFPALGAVLNALVGWRLQRSQWGQVWSKKLRIGSLSVSLIAVGAMLITFSLAVWHVAQLIGLPETQRTLYDHLWPMIRIGSFDLSFDLSLDPLSSVMLLVVTGVGTLIHIYATGYMEKDPSYWRFFSYLNLFIFSMLLLVLGDNFIVMFFGWEGVGLCSYLLIGFWYKDYSKASAGTKAFLTNRVGDFGFISGMLLLVWALGGTWTTPGQYLPDRTPRLVPVVVTEAAHEQHEAAANTHETAGSKQDNYPKHAQHGARPRTIDQAVIRHGKAYLTFTAFPGSKVYIDGATREPLTSPFVRKEMSAQPHSFRIDMGGASSALRLDRVFLAPDKETMLTAVGSVLSFRDLRNQLAITQGNTGEHPFRRNLQHKTLWGISVITLACLGFFLGATGKSAQIPLYVWLPDAMAGPTPVSALIHAATMVTSGVYMVSRLNFLFSLSPTASGVIALTGALTALFAATIGFFQYDIKKVLAYSTVSQLGYMFMGVGVGAYWAGIFHVTTHAFFKACLFLTAGSVIHAMHAVEHDADLAQDMRIMGGLKKYMPLSRWSYLGATLAIAAAPIPFFAGFWSKDEILWKSFTSQNLGFVSPILVWALGAIAAVGTSFYMWRSYYLTFEGEPVRKDIPEKVHETQPVMSWVLVTLAGFSAIIGAVLGFSPHLLGYHHGQEGFFPPLLEHWLEPVMRDAQVSFTDASLLTEHSLMWGTVALSIGTWALAKKWYGPNRPADWEAREKKIAGFSLLNHKYYVDEIYQATFIKAVLKLRLVCRDFDRWVIDGIVNFAGVATKFVAFSDALFDRYVVDGIVNLVANSTLQAGQRIRLLQSGRVQTYVVGLVGGAATLGVLGFLLNYFYSTH